MAVLCLAKKRVSIHRPSDRNKRLFFFLASNFLDLGMKYKTQDRKKIESEIKQKRKNEEEEEECSLEEWGGALCDG